MFAIVTCLVLLMYTLTISSSVLCVLMVEGMSVVVNVMLSLMSVMSPPPALCTLSARTVVELCTLGVFAFRGELGFLNCYDICMCVVNKQFDLLEFVFDSVYVGLQYDEIVSVYCAWRIPAHRRCTQCSILLHLMDICFLTCICL